MKVKQFSEKIGVGFRDVIGARRRILGTTGELSQGDQDALMAHFFPEERKDELAPQFVHGRVQFAREGSIRAGIAIMIDGKRHDVIAIIPRDVHPERLRGKMEKFEYVTVNGKTYYRHASLSNKTWAAVGVREAD